MNEKQEKHYKKTTESKDIVSNFIYTEAIRTMISKISPEEKKPWIKKKIFYVPLLRKRI